MRHRDEHKQAALIAATLQQATERGLGALSVAAIARQAGVSPGTVYIYYQDKDALLEATFLAVSDRLIDAALAGITRGHDLRSRLHGVWRALFALALSDPRPFRFHDQFVHSSHMHDGLRERNEQRLAPMLEAFERGQREGVLKPIGLELIEAFMFRPIHSLVHGQGCRPFTPSAENIDTAFEMAWDAIALRG